MAQNDVVRVDLMAAWLHGVTENQVEVFPLSPWAVIFYPTSSPLFTSRSILRHGGVSQRASNIIFSAAGEVFAKLG